MRWGPPSKIILWMIMCEVRNMAYVLDQVEVDRVWSEVAKYLEEIRKSTPEDAQDSMLPDEDDGMSEGD